MKIEELREIAKARIKGKWSTLDRSFSEDVAFHNMCESHIDALLDVAEAAQKASLYIKDLSSYDDDWMHWLSETLKKLEAVR